VGQGRAESSHLRAGKQVDRCCQMVPQGHPALAAGAHCCPAARGQMPHARHRQAMQSLHIQRCSCPARRRPPLHGCLDLRAHACCACEVVPHVDKVIVDSLRCEEAFQEAGSKELVGVGVGAAGGDAQLAEV
jgi:hypothetical protein